MLLRKTIQRTKIFFHKTLESLKSFLFGGYHMLPKAPPLKPPFSHNDSDPETQQLDQFYRDISKRWESHHGKVMERKNKNVMLAKKPMKEEHVCSQSCMKLEKHMFVNKKLEKRGKEEKKMGSSHEVRSEKPCSRGTNGGSYVLAQKMRELEMMDVTDVDHVLDIEEVLHYYSRLTCPVYLDIVDKFFMDMYSEFYLPQAPVSVNNSMRRLGPLKL